MTETQLIHPEVVRTEVIALADNPDFVIHHDIEHIIEILSEGYAVDSIFHEEPSTGHLRELRVWFNEGVLMTSPGIPLSQL